MPQGKSIWLTYAWDDNTSGDVDFAAQELVHTGLQVKLDRWNIQAGKPLWDQIASFIQDPSESDGWLLYATQASLGSTKCKEEFRYALDRALETRGSEFPVLALFPSSVDPRLIPAAIRVRLYVSLTDPDWKERIIAAVEGRSAEIERPRIEPYELTVYPLSPSHQAFGSTYQNEYYAIELRPRAGVWAPFFAGIPYPEKDTVNMKLRFGPRKHIPTPGAPLLNYWSQAYFNDKSLAFERADNEATPTQSYFVLCTELPSVLTFGVWEGIPQYQQRIRR